MNLGYTRIVKRKKLYIAGAVLVALVGVGYALTPRVPPDGFAIEESPIQVQYYSRAAFNLKPMIDLPIPGGSRLTFPKPAPANLKDLLKDRPEAAGVLVVKKPTKAAYWSPISFPNFSMGYESYYSYYMQATGSDDQHIPVPYARSKERRKAVLNVEGKWCTVTLPEPPPGLKRPTITYDRF